MQAIEIRDDVRDAIVAHARAAAPLECCGLLIGSGTVIDECVPAPNLDPSPATRYLLDPAVHIAANRRLRGAARQVLGCYHSHPRSAPVPSDADRAGAAYPEFVWVIVSLRTPRPEIAAYRLTPAAAVRLIVRPAGPNRQPRAGAPGGRHT